MLCMWTTPLIPMASILGSLSHLLPLHLVKWVLAFPSFILMNTFWSHLPHQITLGMIWIIIPTFYPSILVPLTSMLLNPKISSPTIQSIGSRTLFPPLMHLKRGTWPIFNPPLRWISLSHLVSKKTSFLGQTILLKRLPLTNPFSKSFEMSSLGHIPRCLNSILPLLNIISTHGRMPFLSTKTNGLFTPGSPFNENGPNGLVLMIQWFHEPMCLFEVLGFLTV